MLDLSITSPSSSVEGTYAATATRKPDVSRDDFFNAVINGDMVALTYMLEQGVVDITAIHDSLGQTALHLAIEHGNEDVASVLLAACKDNPSILNAIDRHGYTPLVRAAGQGNVELMAALIKAGATADLRSAVRINLDTIEAINAREKALKLCDIMMQAGGDTTAAMEIAGRSYRADVANLLIRAGADGKQALLNLAETGQLDTIMFLLGRTEMSSENAVGALDEMAQLGNAAGAKILLDAGISEISLLTDYARWRDGTAAETLMKAGAVEIEVLLGILDSDVDDIEKQGRLSTLVNAGAATEDALAAIAENNDVPETDKMAKLRMLLDMGANPAGVLEQLSSEGKTKEMRQLAIADGAAGVELLMSYGRQHDTQASIAFINQGADVATAMNTLIRNGEQDVADLLAAAMETGKAFKPATS